VTWALVGLGKQGSNPGWCKKNSIPSRADRGPIHSFVQWVFLDVKRPEGESDHLHVVLRLVCVCVCVCVDMYLRIVFIALCSDRTLNSFSIFRRIKIAVRLGCFVVSTDKLLTDVSKGRSAFIFRGLDCWTLNVRTLRPFEMQTLNYHARWASIPKDLNVSETPLWWLSKSRVH
jgi:hypothetical protein